MLDGAAALAVDPVNDTRAAMEDGAPAPRNPKSCNEPCDKLEDVSQQRHTRLHDRYRVGDPQVIQTPQELHDLAITSSNVIPKGHLFLTEEAAGPRVCGHSTSVR